MQDDVDYRDWMLTLDQLLPIISSSSSVTKGLRTLYSMGSFAYLAVTKDKKALTDAQSFIDFAWDTVKQRQVDLASGTKCARDMLGGLLALARDKGEEDDFTTANVFTEIWGTCFVGSDTIAFSLTSILYYLPKNQ